MKIFFKCSKCGGGVEPINRRGADVFYFCRPCKLPHDDTGNALFDTKSLSERYNPLQAARDSVRESGRGLSPVTRTALEVSLLQTLQEAYFSGIKDGVLLAYSQDHTEGEPMMEKLGVSNEMLKTELQAKYNELKEHQQSSLTKEASAGIESEMAAVKAKLDELDAN